LGDKDLKAAQILNTLNQKLGTPHRLSKTYTRQKWHALCSKKIMKNLIILLAISISFAHAQETSISKDKAISLGVATFGSSVTMASVHAIDKHKIEVNRFVTNASNARTVIENFKHGDELQDLSKRFDVKPLNKILKNKSLSQKEMHDQLEKALNEKLKHHRLPIVLQKVSDNLRFMRFVNKLGIASTVGGLTTLSVQMKESASKNRLNNTDRSLAIEKLNGSTRAKENNSQAKGL
jgi:hypothetical protein